MKRLIAMVSGLLLLISNPALAADSLWTHQFASESGFPISLSQMRSSERRLVLFWANWCLPCKGELSDLAHRAADVPKDLEIVAVNVDDPSGLPLAQSFLSSIHWPFAVLRDSSGQFFFEHNRSGQLPYSVLVNAGGEVQKSFPKLTEADIDELFRAPAAASESSPAAPAKLETSFGINAEAVDFNGNNGIHNELATFRGFGRADLPKWSAQLQYDFLYQKNEPPSSTTIGDEFGYSFIEYHSPADLGFGAGRGQVRIGDSYEALLAGELLSLQRIPNLPDAATLRGLSAQWDQGDWSFTAFGGEIHPALFANPINPTIDLALPVPGEKVEAGSVFWHRDETDRKTQINLNVVNYHRGINQDLGNSTAIDQLRWGAEVYHRDGKSGLQVRGAQFSTNTGTAGIDAERPYIVDPYFWFNVPGLEQQIYSFHYIEYQSLPDRTLTPVLLENPAVALQGAKKVRAFRLSPKFFTKDESIWFEPIWVFEESIFLTPYQRQNSYGFNLSFPVSDRKLIAFYQDAVASATTTSQEINLLATSPIYGPVSAQALLRHHQSDTLSGDSDGFNLGVDVGRIWKLPIPGKLIASAQWTKQNGYYFGFSQLARNDLFSGHLEWSSGVNVVRLGVGAEPGGIVCTNGVCVQKPPLDGANLEFALNF